MRFLTRTSQNSEGCHHVKSLRNGYNLVKALEIHVLFLITIIVATGGKLRKNQGTNATGCRGGSLGKVLPVQV